MRVLGKPTVARLGVAPQALNGQKRMLYRRTHRALSAVRFFLRLGQWGVASSARVGEILRSRRHRFDRLLLTPVGTVAVHPGFLPVQQFSEHLAVVHIGRRALGAVDEPSLGVSPNV